MSAPVLNLALASLWNRRSTAMLTMLAIALSVTLMLAVEKLRRDARGAFANTISGTDLIVGARSGALQLMLYSVFRIGNATNNMSWDSYKEVANSPRVKWAVPMSLGDSHRGFRVLGTSTAYFQHYRYARRHELTFASGKSFADVREVVLGAAVAAELGYSLGQEVVLAHGAGEINLQAHDQYPMRVVGILNPTGTPVDRTLHVNLESITLIHLDSAVSTATQGSARQRFSQLIQRAPERRDLTPVSITAFLLGTRSKLDIFALQRDINRFEREPLLAVIPGVALQELWDLLGFAETLLRLVSIAVVFTGLLGMTTLILATLEARRREMAVLRAVGARPIHLFGLFMFEALLLCAGGIVLGMACLQVGLVLGQPLIAREFGLHMTLSGPTLADFGIVAGIAGAACVAGAIPAWRAYRTALADGLSVRV
jgi:putative ABC transport system permease protein